MFGDLVREERKKRGLSCRQLAGLAGVSHVTVYRWETGRGGGVSLYSAIMILKALGLKLTITADV